MTDKQQYLVAALLQDLKCPLSDLANQLIKLGAFPQVVALSISEFRSLVLATSGPTGPLWAPVVPQASPLAGAPKVIIPPADAPLAPRDPAMAPEAPGKKKWFQKLEQGKCLTAAEAAECLGLYVKIFVTGIKKGLVKPTMVTKGPKGMNRYHFDAEALEVVSKRQIELRAEGVISSKELQDMTKASHAFVSNALKKFPRVRDGFLLQTKASGNAGGHRVYYKPGALEFLQAKIRGARATMGFQEAPDA